MEPIPLPAISPIHLWGFRQVSKLLFKHRFADLLICYEDELPPENAPLLIYANHPNWWDPIVAGKLASAWYPSHQHYFPMDAHALKRQFGLAKLGFLAVDRLSPAGSRRFIRQARAILSDSSKRLWLTPQARLSDPRLRPVELRPGVNHLTKPDTPMLPVAIEYTFWDESKPYALVYVGKPHPAGERPDQSCARNLEACLNKLSKLAVKRESDAFTTLS